MTATLEELFKNFPMIMTLVGCALMLAMLVVSIVKMFLGKDEKPVLPSIGAPAPVQAGAHASSVSVLAGLSFLCGLAAACLVTASAITAMCVSMSELTRIPALDHAAVDLAAKITLYASLLPAVGAIAFALTARGAISESLSMRGRALYRAGILLALVTGVLVLDAKVLNTASWASSSAASRVWGWTNGSPDLTRGYLGVEFEPGQHPEGVPVTRVIPRSPAEAAGLQAGDSILEIDGVILLDGQAYAQHVAGLKPATKVALRVRRGQEVLSLIAVLRAPFSSLLEMLADQTFDSERLALLVAAGADYRYTSEELKEICETFDSDAYRLQAFSRALPRLLDPQNAYQILAVFDFPSYKQQASRQIVDLQHPPK
jgi:membrane-associated protease RseP (regulator of RpoE activity)